MPFNFGDKNWAIRILVFFDLLYLAMAITFRWNPHTSDLGKDLWGVFMMSNGALFLILNTEGKRQAGIDIPPDNTTQTTATQSVEVKTTSTPVDPTQVPPKTGE